MNGISKDKLLENIKCSKCESTDLKASVDRSFARVYITCKNCKNIDTRKIYDGKLQDLVICSLCGSSTTDIINSYPDWNYPELNNLDDIEVLCTKCYDEHIEELEDKNEKENKKRVNDKIKELKKELEDGHIRSLILTDRQINYILALIEGDDDFAAGVCEDIEDDLEFKETNKVYEDWQNNLADKFKRIIN